MQCWRWWESPNVAASKHKLQLNEVDLNFSNIPEHQSGNKLIPLIFPKFLLRGEFWSSIPGVETLSVCSGWVRGSETPPEGLESSTWGIRGCNDFLRSQLQSHSPTKGHSKIHKLVLLSRAAGFAFAQVLPSKHVNKSSNASLGRHQASPWHGACPVGVHFYEWSWTGTWKKSLFICLPLMQQLLLKIFSEISADWWFLSHKDGSPKTQLGYMI